MRFYFLSNGERRANLGSPVLTESKSVVCGGAASAPSEEGAVAPKGYKGATEGEITRGCYLH